MTALITHPACLKHETGRGHPERPARLQAILDAFAAPEFNALKREEAPLAPLEAIKRVHNPAYVDGILGAVPKSGLVALDADTIMSPGSGEAALRAAGALIAAVDLVLNGGAPNAFCAVRPPGHHAEPSRGMGFCLFNNVAIGAMHARAVHGLKRLAVVDFDVHHGNGTQAEFWSDPALFYASIHQSPLYPGTGDADETGVAHNILNVLMEPGSGSAEFRAAVTDDVFPALEAFKPEMLFISAGFDAHEGDPLAGLRYKTEDYNWVTEKLCAIAKKICNGRVVSTLEGGYDLEALAASASAHIRALMSA